ncbi:phage tail protein [Asaia sp. W19]|uniref:phage tail protein n=1 Tax=unclassified Asaia TaxID=2685023 RepID=UPI000F8D170B|nr:phage tail protein [Asaia sp. W19]RUT27440.1 phage tail protein [Asaia sp. W19]
MMGLSHYFGEDLSLDQGGALNTVAGSLSTRQNILRRLCTNPGAYLWHIDYGAGLPSRVGQPVREDATKGLIARQLALEAGIDQKSPISVTLVPSGMSTYACTIAYSEQGEDTEQVFTFNQDGTI